MATSLFFILYSECWIQCGNDHVNRKNHAGYMSSLPGKGDCTMKCLHHPRKEATGVCIRCGKALCKDCIVFERGKIFCEDCHDESYFNWFDFTLGFKDFGEAFKEWVFTIEKCPQCGKLVKSDFSICPYCRTALKTRCANCGKTVEKNWMACPFCAKKL